MCVCVCVCVDALCKFHFEDQTIIIILSYPISENI